MGENRCKSGVFARGPRLLAGTFGSNRPAGADILDWHVAAILNPFRSRGIGY